MGCVPAADKQRQEACRLALVLDPVGAIAKPKVVSSMQCMQAGKIGHEHLGMMGEKRGKLQAPRLTHYQREKKLCPCACRMGNSE